MSEIDVFVIDNELMRDAISAGIWNRLCTEIRGNEDGHGVDQYIEQLAVGRGDSSKLLGYLDEDISFLSEARRRLEIVRDPTGLDR